MRIGQAVSRTVTVGRGKNQKQVLQYGSVIAIVPGVEVEVQLPGKQALVQTWAKDETHKVQDTGVANQIAYSTGITKQYEATA